MGGIGSGIGGGGARPGAGRPPGARNKKAVALIDQADRDGLLTPIEFMLGVMRDPQQPMRDRMAAANAVMPFMHPKLIAKQIEVRGFIDPDSLSDDELRAALRHLEEISASMENEPAPPTIDQPVVRPLRPVERIARPVSEARAAALAELDQKWR
jgi:hypothetical protein